MPKKEIKVYFKADSQDFSKGVNKASGDLDKFDRRAKTVTASISRSFKGLLGGIGIGAGITAAVASLNSLSAAVDDSTSRLDNLAKAARRLGLSADQLQTIRIQAEAAGIGVSTLDTAFQRFARRVGSGSLDDTFKELNIAIRDNEGNLKSNFNLWNEFGRRLSEVKDQNRQLALAMSAVDTEGVKLVELWRTSASDLDRINKKIEEYGLLFDRNLLNKAEAYQTELGLIRQAQETLSDRSSLGLSGIALEWEKLKLKIQQAKFELLDYFGVYGTQGRTAEERGEDLLQEAEQLRRQRLVLVQKWINAESEAEEKALEANLQKNKEYQERNRQELEKTLAILEGRTPQDVGASGPAGTDYGKPASRSKKKLDELFGPPAELSKAEEAKRIRREVLADVRELERSAAEVVPKLEELDRLFFSGEIGEDAYETLKNKLIPVTEAAGETAKRTGDAFAVAFGNAIASATGQAADAIVDFAIRGEESFKDMTQSILENIAQMITQFALMKALFGGQTPGAAGNSGGLLSGLFGNAKGNAFAGGQVLAFASGGIVDKPTLFPFANGIGLMGEDGAEAILPLKRGPSGNLGVEASGAGTTVNVINNTGQESSVDRSTGPNGEELINVIVGRVAGEIATGGAPAKAIEQSYGLRRAGYMR